MQDRHLGKRVSVNPGLAQKMPRRQQDPGTVAAKTYSFSEI
jgi:hypothetical protein